MRWLQERGGGGRCGYVAKEERFWRRWRTRKNKRKKVNGRIRRGWRTNKRKKWVEKGAL